MKPLFVLILLAVCSFLVQAKPDPVNAIQTLSNANLQGFKALLDISGLSGLLASPTPRVTLMAPTDQAVKAFLANMGISLADLKSNEPLSDAIVAYHMLTGYTLRHSDVFKTAAAGAKVNVYTDAYPFHVTVRRGADGHVLVRDAQGNTAKVVKTLGSGNHVVHVIDRVLYSGTYFNTLGDLMRNYPSSLSTLAAALKAAGLGSMLVQKGFPNTLLMPNNAAFAKTGISLKATPAAALAATLKFHVLPGRHTIPAGFKNKQPVATLLAGQSIAVDYTKGAPGDYVTDARGQKADITKANLFVGQGVAHGIAAVLLPKLPAAPASKPGIVTERAAAKPAAIGRRLAQATPAPAWSDPEGMIDHGKYISVDTSDTVDQETAEDQISAAEDASDDADPSEPGWAHPQLDGGKTMAIADDGDPATPDEDASESQIDNAVSPYDSGNCC